jgi:hypothetical protein
MATAARWIRSACCSPAALRAVREAFGRAQDARAAPAVLWARDEGEDEGHAFTLVVPLRLAPGRPWRWPAWALAPAIATYRLFGARAYADGNRLCVAGAPVADCEASAICHSALISSRLLTRLPGQDAGAAGPALEAAFRARLEAQHGWEFDNAWPTDAERQAIAEALAGEAAGISP